MQLTLALILLERVDDTLQIRITQPEAAREKIAATSGDQFPVGKNVELALAAWGADGLNSETTLDEGRETRDLGLIVASCGAVDDLNLHALLLLLQLRRRNCETK